MPALKLPTRPPHPGGVSVRLGTWQRSEACLLLAPEEEAFLRGLLCEALATKPEDAGGLSEIVLRTSRGVELRLPVGLEMPVPVPPFVEVLP